MDRVPLFFIDDVCHQLQLDEFKQVSQLSRGWSEFGALHDEKRREFVFSCWTDGKKGTYCIKDKKNNSLRVPIASLNINFDRITSVTVDTVNLFRGQGTPLGELERDVLPKVASIVTNCRTWPGSQIPIFLKAFQNCPAFNKITFQQQGHESRDFVTRQVELGYVQTLHLNSRESHEWPDLEQLAKTLTTFVKSGRFYQLTYRGSFPEHVELYALFLERALAGELKPFSFISMYNITDDAFHLMSALHSEFRENSMQPTWRIPNSNRRILLQRLGASFRIKVE